LAIVGTIGPRLGRRRVNYIIRESRARAAPLRSAVSPGRELRGRLVHTSYTDRFVDLVGEGFDCAIRIGYLNDSNLVGRRIGPINGKLVASSKYVREYGAPETPDQLLAQRH
jgi:DNA-binding transcriptional LysR family regulator